MLYTLEADNLIHFYVVRKIDHRAETRMVSAVADAQVKIRCSGDISALSPGKSPAFIMATDKCVLRRLVSNSPAMLAMP